MVRRKQPLFLLGVIAALFVLCSARPAQAQVSPVPDRDKTWQTVTGITMAAGVATQVFMPRVFYADPEVTVGWKGRWHVSVLAPIMTLTAIAALNEASLKNAFGSDRPGCDATNSGLKNCESFGLFSTHTYAAFAALGHGSAIFLFDTTKWSNGRVNGPALVGNVAAPLILGTFTAVGRGVGNFESTGQILGSAGVGLALGFLSGMTYSLMQRPECGYTGSLICW
jgi:hypothetical protein